MAFSPDDPNRLTTSGTGHIRFWRIARTFTGLKLQGDIGKFGKVELSDVDDFAELPDGKVRRVSHATARLTPPSYTDHHKNKLFWGDRV